MPGKREMHAENVMGYRSADGWTLRRERGLTPNGNEINDRWVLRNPEGEFVDVNQYRHDIAERHDLRLVAGSIDAT